MYAARISEVMDRKRRIVAARDTSVSRAAKLMAKKNVGAIMVVEDKRLVGIFTERDAVFRVIAEGRDPRATRLDEVMTPQPATVTPDETFGKALLLMYEGGFRHVPVVKNGEPVGIVSSRSALDPDMEEFVSEAQRRIHLR